MLESFEVCRLQNFQAWLKIQCTKFFFYIKQQFKSNEELFIKTKWIHPSFLRRVTTLKILVGFPTEQVCLEKGSTPKRKNLLLSEVKFLLLRVDPTDEREAKAILTLPPLQVYPVL